MAERQLRESSEAELALVREEKDGLAAELVALDALGLLAELH